jgi:predicted nucleic acid-binding Zn ribbon protein
LVKLLRTIGFLAVLGAILWMGISEMVFHAQRFTQVRALLAVGVVLLIASLVLSMAFRVSNKMTGARCPRCGKPVQQGHTYCQDHLKEVVNRSRDDQRQKGDMG